MVKLVDKQSAFNTGIITDKLKARDDLKQYATGVGDALNFYASKYGPMIKRTGTVLQYMFPSSDSHTGKNSSGRFYTRTIPFVKSVRQSLIIELYNHEGNLRFYFYGFSGDKCGPIASGGSAYYLDTAISWDEVEEGVSYAVSLDVIYLAFKSGNVRPKELRRAADNNWSFVDYEFDDGPYEDTNYDASKTVSVSTTSVGPATVTASGFSFVQSDVGRCIRINHPEDSTQEDRWGWGVITAVTDSTHATVNMRQKVWATTATSEFRLGAWGSAQGWPTLVTIHEQRLVWSGVTNYPWLWMSNSFNFHNFSPSDYSGVIKDSNAIYYNMATDKIAPVKWLASLGSLIIGTEMYEMRMYSAGAGLSPGDSVVRKESTYGVHDAVPVITDDTLIFIQRLQRKLRAMAYDYTRDAYVGPELSVLSESLTVEGMRKIVHQREPNDIVWVLTEDGKLLAVTYDKEQDVVAWTRVEIAGKNARVVEMESVPSDTLKQDMLVLWVAREDVEGNEYMCLEMLCREYLENIDLADVSFLDSSLRYEGALTDTISGLDHLKGQLVRVTRRGAMHEDVRVSSDGKIYLKTPIEDGWIGLTYPAYFETLERDFQDKQISSKMGKVRIHRLVLYMLRTLGLEVHQNIKGIKTQLVTFSPKSAMDTPPEPVSGEKEVDIMTNWTAADLSYTIQFDSEPAMPCTIAGIYSGVEVNAL